MDTDWRGAKGVTECIATLCLTERMADVTFTFPGSDVQLRAHKFVLSLRSAVFEAMFYGLMKEQQREIRIEDSDPESFKLFLRYVYSDATDFKGSTALKCLYLARKYCVESLVRACSLYLETSISGNNVVTILEQADYFAMPELQEKCLLYMANNSEEIFKSEEFLTMTNKFLGKFLARDDINAKEECIFEAAVQWAKSQCAKSGEDKSQANIRRYLGDAFYCIRLPLVPIATFAEVISASGILSADEEIQLFRHIASGSNKGIALSGIVAGFKTDKRKPRFAKFVLSNDSPQDDSPQVGSPGGYDFFARRGINSTNSVTIVISSSLNLKLLSVSGNIFDKGIKRVRLNRTPLNDDQWRLNSRRLDLIDGILLKKEPEDNFLTFILNDTLELRREHSESFDILGAKCTINYILYRDGQFEYVVFAESE